MSSSAVFEKLPAVPRAPTKLRGFHRGTLQQRGTQPIVATTKATGQVLSIRASALYTAYVVSLVVPRSEHDYAVLNKYVAVAALNCVAVLDAYNF